MSSEFVADLVLVIHFGYVLFVVVGLVAIWIGGWQKWRWVRNVWFRIAHLAAIALVASEALIGVRCPLTVWENHLRGTHHESFVQHWVHRLMFFEAPTWVFTAAYVMFAALVAASWIFVRPAKN